MNGANGYPGNSFHSSPRQARTQDTEAQRGTQYTGPRTQVPASQGHSNTRPRREKKCSTSTAGPSEFLQAVWDAATSKPFPRCAARYYLPGLQQLAAFCCELYTATDNDAFFLSCRDAAALLGELDFRVVSRWLGRLERDGVLTRVSTGSKTTGRANEYRFTGEV